MKKMRHRPDFLKKKNAPQAKLMKQNAPNSTSSGISCMLQKIKEVSPWDMTGDFVVTSFLLQTQTLQ